MKEEPIILLRIFHQKLNLLELARRKVQPNARLTSKFEPYNVVPGGLEMGAAWIVVIDENHDITR